MQFRCSSTPSHRIIYRQSIYKHLNLTAKMERAMRFELTTSTLARLRSTPELRPRRDKPFEFRAGGYIRHFAHLASACQGKHNI